MRDIKFRGLTTKGEMIFGSLVIADAHIKHMPKQHTKTWIVTSAFGNGGWFNIRGRKYVKPETVGQFTGVKDKNGSDIYEGDVVGVTDEETNQADVVSFCEENLNYCLLNLGEPICDFIGWNETIEVIGNIHSNPELLEQ